MSKISKVITTIILMIMSLYEKVKVLAVKCSRASSRLSDNFTL